MLELKNVTYKIRDEKTNTDKTVLKDISITFPDNKLTVITGQNGSGKSTLIKLIMGIISPTSGEIFLNNENITTLSIDERARKGISFAFQQPITFKGIKVRELLDLASGEKNKLNNHCDFLSTVGLCAKDYLDRPIDDKLSGGELKRIELAMSIARGAKLNIFDEPEAGIDLWSFDNLIKIFSSLKNATNIIVSHQKKILEIADEIILLKNGEIIAQGELNDIAPMLENDRCGRLRGENE